MGALALVLPVSAGAQVWLALAANRDRLGLGRLSVRGAMVAAFVVMQVLVVAIAELLSIGNDLRYGPLVGAWAATTAIAAVVVLRTGAWARLRGWSIGRWDAWYRQLRAEPLLAVGFVILAAIGAALVLMGWIYRPNNPDSLVYHLTRVAHWAQNGSIEHFATHGVGMVDLAPLHEIGMLHLHVLTGTDRLDGYLQLIGLLVCAVGASEVVRLIGGSALTQLGAALVVVTVPSALLEATSTQNNVFAASAAVSIIVLALAWEPGGRWVAPAGLLGAAVGTGYLVKGSVLPLAGPALVAAGTWAAVGEMRVGSWRHLVRRAASVLAVAVVVALGVAGPFLARNASVFGSPQGLTGAVIFNDETSIRGSAGNVVRSVAGQLRFGDGAGIDGWVSRASLGALETVYGWTGAQEDDPAFTIGGSPKAFEPGDHSSLALAEDYGANPWHTLLYGLTAVALLVMAARRDRRSGGFLAPALAGGLVLGFVIFAATTKWSLFAVRYQLPQLALWAPLAALVVARLHRVVLVAVAAALVVAALPPLLDNDARPLLDRRHVEDPVEAYTAPRADGFPVVPPWQFREVARATVEAGCARVGVATSIGYEYLLWVALREEGWRGEIRHVGVTNDTGKMEDLSYEPCAVVQDVLWTEPVVRREPLVLDTGGLHLHLADGSQAPT